MQHKRRHLNDPILVAMLRGLMGLSILGVLYCLALLVHPAMPDAVIPLLIYALWFASAGLSALMLLRGEVGGIYTLAASTLLVTVYDVPRGAGSLGGAILGLLIGTLIIYYLHVTREDNDTLTQV